MKNPTKSVIVANDIVGLGKVALSTALPVLSACQIEVIPLPTVLYRRIQVVLKILVLQN